MRWDVIIVVFLLSLTVFSTFVLGVTYEWNMTLWLRKPDGSPDIALKSCICDNTILQCNFNCPAPPGNTSNCCPCNINGTYKGNATTYYNATGTFTLPNSTLDWQNIYTCTNSCDNDYKCEIGQYQNETQSSCPSDCFTTIQTTTQYAAPGQNITLIVMMNDSRIVNNEFVNLTFYLNTGYWNNIYCPPSGVKFNGASPPAQTTITYYTGVTNFANAIKVVTSCEIPPGTPPGTYSISVYPQIYSNPTPLGQGKTTVHVSMSIFDFLWSVFSSLF